MAIAQVKENKEEKGVLKYGMECKDDAISSNIVDFSMRSRLWSLDDGVRNTIINFRCRPCYIYNNNCFVLANYYYYVGIFCDRFAMQNNKIDVGSSFSRTRYRSYINNTCFQDIKLLEGYINAGAHNYEICIMCPDEKMDFHSFNFTEYSFLLYKDEDLVSAKSLRENPEIDCSKIDFLSVNAYRNFDFILHGNKYKDVIRQRNKSFHVLEALGNAVYKYVVNNEEKTYEITLNLESASCCDLRYDTNRGNLFSIKELDFKALDPAIVEAFEAEEAAEMMKLEQERAEEMMKFEQIKAESRMKLEQAKAAKMMKFEQANVGKEDLETMNADR